jgi:hypothetical protein
MNPSRLPSPSLLVEGTKQKHLRYLDSQLVGLTQQAQTGCAGVLSFAVRGLHAQIEMSCAICGRSCDALNCRPGDLLIRVPNGQEPT